MRTYRIIKYKIRSLKALKKTILLLKKNGKSIVFTNGCFDLLHYGHAKYLEDARKKGDILIVAVNSDSSVKSIKDKNRPIVKQNYRLKLVAALECVDFVTLFSDKTPLKIIKYLKPDVLVKGSDWKIKDIVGADFIRRCGGKVFRINSIKKLSTTNLIKKIAKAY